MFNTAFMTVTMCFAAAYIVLQHVHIRRQEKSNDLLSTIITALAKGEADAWIDSDGRTQVQKRKH